MLRRSFCLQKEWRWLRAAGAEVKPTAVVNHEQVLRQYLHERLPWGSHPQLSPAALLQLTRRKLFDTPHAEAVSLGSLFDAAAFEGHIPPKTTLEEFAAHMDVLCPIALDISSSGTGPVNACATSDEATQRPWEAPHCTWIRSLTVSRQPWVPRERQPPDRRACAWAAAKDAEARISALLSVVPTFFVSVKLVQGVMREAPYKAHLYSLRWSDLASAEDVGGLIEWTRDKQALRLAPWASRDARINGREIGHADSPYRLLPRLPVEFHAAVALVASAVPTFFTPTTADSPMERLLSQMVDSLRETRHAELADRFPNVQCLFTHPDLLPFLEFAERATMRRVLSPQPSPCSLGEEGKPFLSRLLVRLRSDFSHARRGLADPFHRSAHLSAPVSSPSPHERVFPVEVVAFVDQLQMLTDIIAASDGGTEEDGGQLAAIGVSSTYDEPRDASSSAAAATALITADPVVTVTIALMKVKASTDPIQVLTFSRMGVNDEGSVRLPEPVLAFLKSDRVVKIIAPGGASENGSRVLSLLCGGVGDASESMAGALAGTLPALCQCLGAPVGEATLALPNLHTMLCKELGVRAGESADVSDLTANATRTAESLLAAHALILCGAGRWNRGRWRDFLLLDAAQRRDHACTARLQQYLAKDSGGGVPGCDGLTSLSKMPFSEKKALLKELMFQHGPERQWRLPPAATGVTSAVSSDRARDNVRDMVAAASDGCAVTDGEERESADKDGTDASVDYDPIEALLEEAGRLPLRSAGSEPHSAAMSCTATPALGTENASEDADGHLLDSLLSQAGTSAGDTTIPSSSSRSVQPCRAGRVVASFIRSDAMQAPASAERPESSEEEDMLAQLTGDEPPSSSPRRASSGAPHPPALTTSIPAQTELQASSAAGRGGSVREAMENLPPSFSAGVRPLQAVSHSFTHDSLAHSRGMDSFSAPLPHLHDAVRSADMFMRGVSREDQDCWRVGESPNAWPERGQSRASPASAVAPPAAFWDPSPQRTRAQIRSQQTPSLKGDRSRPGGQSLAPVHTSPFSLSVLDGESSSWQNRGAGFAAHSARPAAPVQPLRAEGPKRQPDASATHQHRREQRWRHQSPHETVHQKGQPLRSPRGPPTGSQRPSSSNRRSSSSSEAADRVRMRELISDIVRSTAGASGRHAHQARAETPRPQSPRQQGMFVPPSGDAPQPTNSVADLRAMLNTEMGREVLKELLDP